MIDPAYWIEPQDYVRTCLPAIQWFVEVYPIGGHGSKVIALPDRTGRATT